MRPDNDLLRAADDGLDGARGIVYALLGVLLGAVIVFIALAGLMDVPGAWG